jgi:NAD(P)-dependent dehydrogenase (short-subunit alcohol dehydrogenase family)/acyl dehydratase/putative sterol carrier protein
MGLFDGKVVIVTGAGGGLGRSHALAFAAEGAQVVVNDLGGTRDGSGGSSSMADQVVAEIRKAGGTAVANYDNVATVEGGANIARTALDAFGRIDVLVNNAGILRDKAFKNMDESMWDAVMAVHTKSLFAVTQPCFRHMLESGEGGTIVNTTSLAGLLGNYGQANYATAKAGTAGFTRTLAMEGRKAGVRVNAVAPVAKTRMTEDIDMVPDDMRPEHVTPMVLFLASGLSDGVTGRVFGVHGNQMFEYQMTQTPGVSRAGAEPWPVAEVADRFADITRAEAEAPAPEGRDDVTVAFSQIPAGFKAEAGAGWTTTMHWILKGAADQTLTIADGACTHSEGLVGTPTCTVKSDRDTVVGMFTGQIDPTKAFMAGKIAADNLGDMMKMGGVFDFPAIGAAIAAALGGGSQGDPAAAKAAKKPAGGAPKAPVDFERIVGRRYACDYVVTDEDTIRAYALATNDPNPRYVEGEQVAPPLYAVRLFKPLMTECVGDPDLSLDYLRLVHGEQDMTWHGPLRAREIVNLRATLESVGQKGKGCVVAWRMMGVVGGEVRVEARMSVFVMGQVLPGVPVGTTYGQTPPGGAEAEGEPAVTRSMAVAMDQPVRYAAASLDDNPIHLDEAVAKSAGHPSVILHGLCSMAFASKALVDGLLDSDPARLHRFAVRFSRPVLPGWTLTTRIFAAGTTDAGRAAYVVDVVNQGGVKVITNGWAEIDPA